MLGRHGIRRTRKVLGATEGGEGPREGVTIQSLKGPVRPTWGGWNPGYNIGNPQFPLLLLCKMGKLNYRHNLRGLFVWKELNFSST